MALFHSDVGVSKIVLDPRLSPLFLCNALLEFGCLYSQGSDLFKAVFSCEPSGGHSCVFIIQLATKLTHDYIKSSPVMPKILQ